MEHRGAGVSELNCGPRPQFVCISLSASTNDTQLCLKELMHNAYVFTWSFEYRPLMRGRGRGYS
jgi:hypothetical protein